MRGIANVKTIQYVSLLSVCWQPGDAECLVGIDLVSYPDLQQANAFQLTAGRYPGPGEIVMEQGDRSLHTFALGDSVTLSDGGRSTRGDGGRPGAHSGRESRRDGRRARAT